MCHARYYVYRLFAVICLTLLSACGSTRDAQQLSREYISYDKCVVKDGDRRCDITIVSKKTNEDDEWTRVAGRVFTFRDRELTSCSATIFQTPETSCSGQPQLHSDRKCEAALKNAMAHGCED